MNAKRRRSPEEQEAFDEIKRFKDVLRVSKRDCDAEQGNLLAAPRHACNIGYLFERYALARDEVAEFEAKLKDMEDAYRALRERGDT